MPRGLPGGTVTFLFTDIEDSTRRWDEAPSDMVDGLRVHDAIARSEGGTFKVVKNLGHIDPKECEVQRARH